MMSILLVSLLSSLINSATAALPDELRQTATKYRTYSGECPSKSSDMLSMIIMKEFEKTKSLKAVKEKILAEKLDEKYFLSDYRISYNPVIHTLSINTECPEPLAKVQVYKSNGEEHYSAILASNAKVYDPTYEILMKAEKKLKANLPLLAISMEQLDGSAPRALARFVQMLDNDLRHQISEIILNKDNELTIVFSLGPRATSVFMGADMWDEKVTKLSKIVGYVGKNKRYPSSINLVNSKKVVVKF
jgi:hypothetical protein